MPAHAGSAVDVLAFDYAAGSHERLHAHPHEALLIHAEAGEYRVFTEDRMWALLPSLPQPRHAGLRRVAARQLDELAAEWTLQACAEVAHLSVRTFCRVFPKEAAGLTWPAWVRQARMMVGRQLLELGASVNQAAAQVGYDSQSAFAAAYRRIHGVSPSSHVKGLAARS